jgi:hypothetical protein
MIRRVVAMRTFLIFLYTRKLVDRVPPIFV